MNKKPTTPSVCAAFAALLLSPLSTPLSTPTEAALVASWDFDAGSGTSVADSSGNANNGTLLNPASTPWVPGIRGSAINYDPAVGTEVWIPDSASLYTANALTITAWIYSRDITRDAPIVAQEGSGGLALNLQTNSGEVRVFLERGNDSEGTFPWDFTGAQPASLTLTQWTHVAVTWDGATVRTYKNGTQLPTTFPFSGVLNNSSDFFSIGRNSASNNTRFDGLIDEVRVYNAALTQTEIQAVMAPEPSTAIMLVAGAASLCATRRRNKLKPNNG